jgi:hypothetical protein
MPVQKNRQAAGSFTINLRANTPQSVIDAYAIASKGFGHVIITAVPVDGLGLNAAGLLALSIFTGVYRAEAGNRRLLTLEGSHASLWLGDQDGKGEFQSLGSAAKTFVQWFTQLKPSQLAAGTVTATGGTVTYYDHWNSKDVSPRQALDTVCSMFSAEWEVTDALTLNGGTATALYGATPTVIVSPFWQGRDAVLTALRADIGYRADVEDYNLYTFEVYNGGASSVQAGPGALTYKTGFGATNQWHRRIDSSQTTDATAAQNLVNSQNARFNTVRQALTVRTDSPAVMADVRCGTRIYVWHPDVGVYDFANEQTYRGELAWPLITRVEAIQMPVTAGMGVSFLDGDGVITDLSRYFEPESPGATLTVGAPERSLRGTVIPQNATAVPAG